jgi:cephalosporin-C deacetylase-like acetyl esterase
LPSFIPKAAKAKALPLMLVGHGLLGTGEGMVNGMADFAESSGYVIFGTDWTGLSRAEDPVAPGGNGAAGEALTDFNRLPYVTDRLQQGLINAMVLVRTVRGKLAQDPKMQIEGHAAADTTKVQYLGISLGGIMGGAFMGYTPDVTEAVLGVPGGVWSTMFQRSSNWPRFKLLIGGAYSDYVDQQLLLAMAQSQFDYGRRWITFSRPVR